MQIRIHQHAIGIGQLSRMCKYLSALLFIFVLHQPAASAGPAGELATLPPRNAVATMTEAQKAARLAEIDNRVKAIKAMDKSNLTKEERKGLRMELRRLHKETLSIGHRNLFISIGATILVIVVLIIILH
jgi:hypothetical protein